MSLRVQLAPPARSETVPFSAACQVTSVEVSATPRSCLLISSTVTAGGVESFTTTVASEPVFPAPSATQTRIAFAPSLSVDDAIVLVRTDGLVE